MTAFHEGKENTVYKIWSRFVWSLFIVCVTFLAAISLFFIAEPEWGRFNEKATIVERSPFVTLGYVLIVSIVFGGIYIASMHIGNSFIRKYFFPVTTLLAHLAMGIGWICSNDYPTVADQKFVCDAAMALENGLALDNPGYFIRYPFNEGMLYAIRLSMKVTGMVDPFAWKCFNIVAVIAIDIVLMLFVRELAGEDYEAAINVVSVMLLPFVPIVLYSSFVYGTLVSMALAFWALWGTIRLIRTGKWFYGILPVLFLPIANRVYSGTLIATIAVVITLLVELFKADRAKRIKFLVVVIATLFLYFVSDAMIQHVFFLETGIKAEEGGNDYSTAGHIYMGIAAEDCVAGPGSYSDIVEYIYETKGDESGSYFKQQNIAVIKEYLRGERDLSFFLKKTEYQWLDPWFGGITMTCYAGGNFEVGEAFYNFIFGPVPKILYEYWLRNFLPFVYVMALIGIILKFKKTEFDARILLSLYFVGGFIFQLFWESKSRYCLPYFLALLPLAALGIASLKLHSIGKAKH